MRTFSLKCHCSHVNRLSTSRHIHLLEYSVALHALSPLEQLILYLYFWVYLWGFDSAPLTHVSIFRLVPPNLRPIHGSPLCHW